jgi:hypothetical protein
MADVFACAAAHGVTLRMDGTEVQVRRPKAKRPGRRAFISGKKKMNAKKAAVFTDGAGRTLFADAFRPGRMHDQTAVKTEGIADLLTRFPQVRLLVDAGYLGWPRPSRTQVEAPPKKPGKDAPPKKSPPTRNSGTSSPPSGSASSTPTPTSRNGGPCSATSETATTSTRPSRRSPDWSPTAPPPGKPPANPPGQHDPPLIVHHVVTGLALAGDLPAGCRVRRAAAGYRHGTSASSASGMPKVLMTPVFPSSVRAMARCLASGLVIHPCRNMRSARAAPRAPARW